MRYSDRIKIIIKYRDWLVEQNEKNNFNIKDCPETFLVFLETIGYLKEGEYMEIIGAGRK